MKTVCIEMRDDGTLWVGLEPTEGEEGGGSPEAQMQDMMGGGMGGEPPESSPEEMKEDESYMSQVKSLEDALTTARDLLTSEQAQEANNAEDAFQGGFQRGSGKSMGGM